MKRRQPEGTAHYQGGAGGATLVDRGPAEQPHRGHTFTWAFEVHSSGFMEFEVLQLAMRVATQATKIIVAQQGVMLRILKYCACSVSGLLRH